MTPMKWYTVELQMAENTRGNINLLFRGYVYCRDNDNISTTNWRCVRKNSCRARVTTRGHRELKIGLREHSHPPQQEVSSVPEEEAEMVPDSLTPVRESAVIKCDPVEFDDVIQLD